MWINRTLFQRVLDQNQALQERVEKVWNTCHILQGKYDAISAQKTKDDITIDWMRHRINALEKERTILLQKAAGVALPTPEIVPTRPGTISELPDFNAMLEHFEDIGEDRAQALGIGHDPEGHVSYEQQKS